MLRTKSEQKAYLAGYEMCAECIKKYLSDEGKELLEIFLSSVRNAVEIEDIETEVWNGMNGQMVVPKGTFEKILAEPDDGFDI